jgi:hypothetical protein
MSRAKGSTTELPRAEKVDAETGARHAAQYIVEHRIPAQKLSEAVCAEAKAQNVDMSELNELPGGDLDGLLAMLANRGVDAGDETDRENVDADPDDFDDD